MCSNEVERQNAPNKRTCASCVPLSVQVGHPWSMELQCFAVSTLSSPKGALH